MPVLLVVEDDDTIGQSLLSGLRAGGFEVSWVRTGGQAIDAASRTALDLLILDLGLPDVDGYELCRDLRGLQPHAVIVMLTARQEEMDVVTGLESGADDYLTKPFRLAELLARVRAHLRRADTAEGGRTISVGSLDVDAAARIARVGGVEMPLRSKEFDLLLRLAQDAGSAVSREVLMNDVWDENWFGSTKTLDVHVASLRRKLSNAGETDVPTTAPMRSNAPTITTLRGHGYRLDRA